MSVPEVVVDVTVFLSASEVLADVSVFLSVRVSVFFFTGASIFATTIQIVAYLVDLGFDALLAATAALGETPEVQEWITQLVGTGLGVAWLWLGFRRRAGRSSI